MSAFPITTKIINWKPDLEVKSNPKGLTNKMQQRNPYKNMLKPVPELLNEAESKTANFSDIKNIVENYKKPSCKYLYFIFSVYHD